MKSILNPKKKKINLRKIFFVSLCLIWTATGFCQQKPMTLWFDKPAYQPTVFSYCAKEFKEVFHFEEKGWFEAMPVGNGKMGAMVFGGVFSERIPLNEESRRDGYARDAVNLLAKKTCRKFSGSCLAAKQILPNS